VQNNLELLEIKTKIARLWNPPDDKPRKPVICIHGWKDNCATWDNLLPHLVKAVPQYEYLAIDLPGHGHSSHFPPGMIYAVQDIWVLIQRLINHYGWSKISLMGHSMGAQLSFMFAGTHPLLVEKLVREL